MEDKCDININSIKIQELEKRIIIMQEASNTALKIASNDLKSRLDAMNEFRAQLKDNQMTFITREIFEKSDENFNRRIQNLELISANIQGRFWMFAVISTFISSLIVIGINILLNYSKFIK